MNQANLSKVGLFLGFAQKARKVLAGTNAVAAGLQRKQVKLIVVARDAKPSTLKLAEEWSGKWSLPLILWGTKQEIGLRLGRSPRALAGITDQQLAAAIRKAFLAESE